MVEEATTGRGYEKPHPSNLLSQDVNRLRAASDLIDGDIVALFAALAGKAPTVHVHAIDDITGLSTALAAKAGTSHSHSLGSLTDVSTVSAGEGFILRLAGGVWSAVQLAVADISGLSNTLSSIQTALATMDDGTY